MPSAREATIEAIIEADDTAGEVDVWKSDAEAWAGLILDALLAPSEERCTECDGSGEVWHTNEFGSRMLLLCEPCGGLGKRSSAPLIVETLREMGYTVHEKRWIDTEEARELFASDSPSSTSEEKP